MPRRSDADLSIVPMLPGRGRPRAAASRSIQIEARAWNDIVDALPGQWVDTAGQIILRRTAAQIAIAERLEARLRDLATMSGDEEALAAEAELAVMHRATSKSVIACLTALRATPRSRMAAREGRAKFERGPAFRPWEIVAKRSDGQP